MESLTRGVIAMRTSATQVYVGWRMFGTDTYKSLSTLPIHGRCPVAQQRAFARQHELRR
jgi:hypothetical protein